MGRFTRHRRRRRSFSACKEQAKGRLSLWPFVDRIPSLRIRHRTTGVTLFDTFKVGATKLVCLRLQRVSPTWVHHVVGASSIYRVSLVFPYVGVNSSFLRVNGRNCEID